MTNIPLDRLDSPSLPWPEEQWLEEWFDASGDRNPLLGDVRCYQLISDGFDQEAARKASDKAGVPPSPDQSSVC